ncbi:uncharacterized protein LOC144349212, partial [Saccoglossus kowalevskii]
SRYTRICSVHFMDGKKAHWCDVPSIFPWTKAQRQGKPPSENDSLKSEIDRLIARKFGIHKFQDNDEAICFYTGFPDFERFKICFDYFGKSVEHITSVTRQKLTPMNKFFMVMCRLRLEIDIWPSRELVNETMPECFKQKYLSTRVIIDATEIQMESPSAPDMQSVIFSNYKSRNTVKALVGIIPSGAVSFVSDLYT